MINMRCALISVRNNGQPWFFLSSTTRRGGPRVVPVQCVCGKGETPSKPGQGQKEEGREEARKKNKLEEVAFVGPHAPQHTH
jgi:hypothetical protein